MINFNGSIFQNNSNLLSNENRGFKYGDALFETVKVIDNKILFWEDHYFRLMASMRLLRMDITMNFTLEFLYDEIQKTLKANNLEQKTVRVRLDIYRGNGGYYLPSNDAKIKYLISVHLLEDKNYLFSNNLAYEVDLYKDFYVANNLLSGLKTNNKIIQVLGSIYAQENKLDNCLVLNTNKMVVEALNGNIFLVANGVIKTPPLEDGCLRGVMRKQILQILVKDINIKVEETSISPFELQKADELFITNVIKGVIPVNIYRKKTFNTTWSSQLVEILNNII